MYQKVSHVLFFFTGATVSAWPALSVLFVCCQLSCFYETVLGHRSHFDVSLDVIM